MITTRTSPRLRCLLASRSPLLALAIVAASAVGCGSGGGGSHDAGQDTSQDTSHDAAPDGGDASVGTPDGGDASVGTPDGGADTQVACPTGGAGQLVVATQGLPAGAMPMIRVSGGGLAAPMVLTPGTPVSLTSGDGYEVEYRRVKVAPAAGDVVGKAFFVSASSFGGCVASGVTTTVTLTYTQEPGSDHAWIGVSDAPTLGDEIAGFLGTDIAATGAKNPAVWKTQNFTGRPAAGAFDMSGNLWVPGGDVVNMYSMATLATPGNAAPAVVLTQPMSSPALFAAFDKSGNLWVSRGAPANTVVRYSADQLAASGAPTPSIVLSSAELVNPAGLAFDAHDTLWVASEGKDEVVGFLSGKLAASSAAAPDYVLTASTPPSAPVAADYTAPNGLAFDQAGDLWVGFDGELVAFTPAQLMATAKIAGPLALDVSTGTGGFAFDESGGIWMAGSAPNTFQRIPKAALATSGAAAPDIVITSSELGYGETLVLDPSPTWSFLHDWM